MKDISERCDDYIEYAEAVKKFHDLSFYKQAKAEIDRLRARLAEIEGQGKPEPVAMAVLGQLFWKGNPKDHAGDSMDLYAAPVPAIPEGWQLVPVEPTPKMLRMAGIAVHNATYWERSYKAMLAAAPQPEGNERLQAECEKLVEALELMVTTHDEGGWPTATIAIAHAALNAYRKQEGRGDE